MVSFGIRAGGQRTITKCNILRSPSQRGSRERYTVAESDTRAAIIPAHCKQLAFRASPLTRACDDSYFVRNGYHIPLPPSVAMIIGVPKERAEGEHRVALVPESVSRLVKGGVRVVVERGAGTAAGFTDQAYEKAGASLGDTAAAFGEADLLCKVQTPTTDETVRLKAGAHLVSLMQPATSSEAISALNARGVTGFALELVPRITRAQSMDVLSSQATVAGYKAVLVGASALGKFLPMLTTAAGTIAPSKCCVLGAGVAGLQAIATARRLGAVVSAFDIRAAAAEQIRSLGATVVAQDLIASDSETAGGYAKEQSAEQQAAIQSALKAHLAAMDLVITTAQIPGRAAPRLISTETVRTMSPGAVIVDLAAESGGNCEATRVGETVEVNGVKVIGPVNLPATTPTDASQMLSRNILTFVQHLLKDGALHVDPTDEITGAMIVTGKGGATAATGATGGRAS